MTSIVSQSDFAREVGVARQAVSKAIRNGRLSECIVKTESKDKIDLVKGILEWFNNADLRKDRGHHIEEIPKTSDGKEDFLPISESTKIDRHYTAKIKAVEYYKECGTLTSGAKFTQEAFKMTRTARDSVLYVPQKTQPEIKVLLVELIEESLKIALTDDELKEFDSLPDIYRKKTSIVTESIKTLISERLIEAMTTISEKHIKELANK